MPLDNSRPARSRRSTLRLRDVIRPGVRVLFVGINPGLRSAAVGHHFAGHSNRFWKLLYESQLVSEPIDWSGDVRLPEWGFGITNLVGRATAGISELQPLDYHGGRRTLLAKIRRFEPELIALVRGTLFRSLFPKADFRGLGVRRTAGSAERFVCLIRAAETIYRIRNARSFRALRLPLAETRSAEVIHLDRPTHADTREPRTRRANSPCNAHTRDGEAYVQGLVAQGVQCMCMNRNRHAFPIQEALSKLDNWPPVPGRCSPFEVWRCPAHALRRHGPTPCVLLSRRGDRTWGTLHDAQRGRARCSLRRAPPITADRSAGTRDSTSLAPGAVRPARIVRTSEMGVRLRRSEQVGEVVAREFQIAAQRSARPSI